jgi:hypothetical protein
MIVRGRRRVSSRGARCVARRRSRRRAAAPPAPVRYEEPGAADGLAARPLESFLVGFAIGAGFSALALAADVMGRA